MLRSHRQVEKAYEYLVEHGTAADNPTALPPSDNMRFMIEINNKPSFKGIYLRNWCGTKTTDVTVSVLPVQFDDTRASKWR